MRPGNVFQLEIAAALAGGRTLLLRLGLPLLLGLPFVLVRMPPAAKVAGVVMLVVFVSFMGAAVAAGRRRADGLIARLRVLPIPRALVLADLLLAGAAMDAAQLAPVVVLFVIVHGRAATAIGLLALAGTFVTAVAVLNLLGMLLAAAVRTNAEVHLLAALGAGLIALLSGVFPVPDRLAAVVGATAPLSPVGQLARSLAGVVAGRAPGGPPEIVAGAVAAALVAAAVARGLGLWPGPHRGGATNAVEKPRQIE